MAVAVVVAAHGGRRAFEGWGGTAGEGRRPWEEGDLKKECLHDQHFQSSIPCSAELAAQLLPGTQDERDVTPSMQDSPRNEHLCPYSFSS